MKQKPPLLPVGAPDTYQAILTAFTDAVIVVTADGVVEWMNPAAEQLIGVGVNVVRGEHLSSLFSRNSELQVEALAAIRRGISLTLHDTPFHTSHGVRLPVGVTIHPFGPEKGEEPKGGVLIMRDLTALKSLERFMAMSDRITELSTLAAGIAHEIKNPLGGIRGAAQLLESEIPDDLSEYTALIMKETDRINRLVTELIELNQPKNFPMGPENLYPPLDDAVRIMAPQIEGKRIVIRRIFDPSLPPVIGNADKLRQIFLNLVKNAVESCQPYGTISLTSSLAWRAPRALTNASRRRRFVVVEIVDDGEGLSEEDEAKLMTPFYSRKPGGSGLGLSMTMNLVQAHDGALEVKNREDGQRGVIASVYLPYALEG
ncbi:MAG: PAS domain-containing protein [Nitrospinae bacterium]|nr:PAS domain-containing protein [Nitrospinota bacterium]